MTPLSAQPPSPPPTCPPPPPSAYRHVPNAANPQAAALARASSANPKWKRTTLDGFGRVTRVESGSGPSTSTPSQVVDTQYAPCGCSPLGKLWRVSQPYSAVQNGQVWTTYAYDERGRVVSVTAPDASVTTTQYPTTATDPC